MLKAYASAFTELSALTLAGGTVWVWIAIWATR